MKHSISTILTAAILFLIPSAADAALDSKGPKIVEIDETGNIRTTRGTDVGQTARQANQPNTGATMVPRDGNAKMSICDPAYRWSPINVSPDTVARTRAFYGNVTQPYERAQRSARATGVKVSSQQEVAYWDAHKTLMDSVPQSERRVVERGASPRLSWWCSAPPVIVKAPPPPVPSGSR